MACYRDSFTFLSSTLQRNLLFPYSGYKRSLFYPDDGGRRFIQNAGNYLPGYMASHPRIQ
jgi:hypothetical protein